MKHATFSIEKKFWQQGHAVIGLDEVGRGALAGPITVGAACFKPDWMDSSWKKIQRAGINDSKVLTPGKREVLSKLIQSQALAYATASCTVDDINSKGVTKATNNIFNDVVQIIITTLPKNFNFFIIIDGIIAPFIKNIEKKCLQTVVDGDAKSISIAAASIVAKVDRDHQMIKLSNSYPQYCWDQNKGYGTKIHIRALQKYKATPLHRIKYIDSIVGNLI